MEIRVVVNLPDNQEDCFHCNRDSVDEVITTAKEDNPNWTSMVITITREGA